MDYKTTTTLSRSSLVRLWPWLLVVLVLLFIGFIRFRLLDVPLERDEGEYAYAGQLILQGIPPFELAYNMKLPGTYFAYALGMAVFGQSVPGIHLMLLVVNLATMVFVFLLGREMFGVIAGLVACASYGLMSASPAVVGLAAHATQFVVFFAVPGTWLLWRALRSGRRGPVFFSGLLYGLAFVMKQPGLVFSIFGFLILIWCELTQSPRRPLRDSAKKTFVFMLGVSLPFLAICIFLACAGVFAKFWFWTFSYAWQYATNIPFAEGFGNLLKFVYSRFVIFCSFGILSVAGIILGLRNKSVRKRTIFVLGLLGFSFLGTMPGGNFFSHYFILMLPAFALMTGMASELICSMPLRFAKVMFLIFPIGALAYNACLQWPVFFGASPQALSQIIYEKNPFIESVVVGNYIREHADKNARVAVMGSEPEIYFYGQRHSATGYLYTYPLMENQPYAATMQREMIREIELARPEYIVMVSNSDSWGIRKSSHTEILEWAQKYTAEHYECVGLVNDLPGTEAVELWGDAAKNYGGKLEQFLEIYKRRLQP